MIKPGPLRERGPVFCWLVLLLGSIVCISLLEVVHLPAALLLGATVTAIAIGFWEGAVVVPPAIFVCAQGVVGCLIARNLTPDIFGAMRQHWQLFVFSVCAVIIFSMALGVLLARRRILPGSTAIWGCAPGAATAMMLMAQAFGADVRLVAFMQFLRVLLVALTASLVARYFGIAPVSAHAMTPVWFPPVAPLALSETLALALAGSWIGARSKIPAGALLVPMLGGALLNDARLIIISLPPWLLALSYAVVGWTIGLRFTREIVLYAARAFLRVAASILILIAACAGLAYVLHALMGIDPLTAYLATSPGGADSIAIIAASSNVDIQFVVAMQASRFLLVLLVGPSLAKFVAGWASGEAPLARRF